MQTHIETHRLILRELEERDVQGIFDLDSDPEVHRYLGEQPIKRLQEAEAIIQYVRNQYEADGIGRWAVIEKASQEFVGWAGLKFEREVRQDMHYYDLGYRLKKKFWGKGIATEAAREALAYGFQEMNLPKIYGGAHIDNIGSNKVLQKVGFTFLETFDYEDAPHHWYGLARQDWQAK
ncbi:MAG: GNAT family N-acetyltransferase [Bacteroidota bacterium]